MLLKKSLEREKKITDFLEDMKNKCSLTEEEYEVYKEFLEEL